MSKKSGIKSASLYVNSCRITPLCTATMHTQITSSSADFRETIQPLGAPSQTRTGTPVLPKPRILSPVHTKDKYLKTLYLIKNQGCVSAHFGIILCRISAAFGADYIKENNSNSTTRKHLGGDHGFYRLAIL